MERTNQPASGEDLKKLVAELGQTIQRTLAESPEIAGCLNRMRGEGYEVSLVLEARVAPSRSEARTEEQVSTFDFRVEKSDPAQLRMTPLDRKFLRSLKISVEDD